MWHRLGFCGEELVLGIVLAFALGGAGGAHSRNGPSAGIESAAFSIPESPVSADLTLGRRRVEGRALTGWRVCLEAADGADMRCFEVEFAWKGPMLKRPD